MALFIPFSFKKSLKYLAAFFCPLVVVSLPSNSSEANTDKCFSKKVEVIFSLYLVASPKSDLSK